MSISDSGMDATLNLDSIPQELKALPQWVLWKNADGTKKPFTVTGQLASSTDANTWTSFDEAAERFAITEAFDGIGFVFSGSDGFCGIDLDSCRDPATGELSPWAASWVERFCTYTEISPSGTGVKLIVQGRNPRGTGGNVKIDQPPTSPEKAAGVEIYDRARYFTVTGWKLDSSPSHIATPRDPQALTDFVATYWPARTQRQSSGPATDERRRLVERCKAYIGKMPAAVSGDHGHDRCFAAACVLFQFGLSDREAWDVLLDFNERCQPKWSEAELRHKLSDARDRVTEAGNFGDLGRKTWEQSTWQETRAKFGTDGTGPRQQEQETRQDDNQEEPRKRPPTLRRLLADYPKLKPPVLEGLLREAEVCNLVASPKMHKSWLTLDLAISIAAGVPFLGFSSTQGRVLICDNELHGETLANRFPRVCDAKGVELDAVADWIDVECFRGKLRSIYGLEALFKLYEPGELRLIVLDSLYRFLPANCDENSNGEVTGVYNELDRLAALTKAAIVVVHHSSKGSQSEKRTTDVGSGAGAQSRAADSHLVLRQHQEKHHVVCDAVTRSWKPIDPFCLRWEFPIFQEAELADPTALAGLKATRTADPWTAARFVEQFIFAEPRPKVVILTEAEDIGLSDRKANELLKAAVAKKLAWEWKDPEDKRTKLYATCRQPLEVRD